MAESTTVTIRLDEDLKKAASAVAEHYGIDLSTATRMFYQQMVNTNSIPVSLDYESAGPSAEVLQAIRQIVGQNGVKLSGNRGHVEGSGWVSML